MSSNKKLSGRLTPCRSNQEVAIPEIKIELPEIKLLTEYLISEYNQGVNDGLIGGWFRRKKIEAKQQTIGALTQTVRMIHENSTSLQEYQVHLLTYQEKLYLICQGKILEGRIALDKLKQEHLTYIAKQEAERERIKFELDRMQILNERELIENRRLEAIAEKESWLAMQEKERYHLLQLRGEVIRKIKDEYQLGKVTIQDVQLMMTLLMEVRIDPHMFTADLLYEQIKASVRRMNAEAESAREDARTKRTERQYKEWKYKENRQAPDEDD